MMSINVVISNYVFVVMLLHHPRVHPRVPLILPLIIVIMFIIISAQFLIWNIFRAVILRVF